jgi:hypothetical protein
MADIGNNCVCCNKDTSNTIFAEGEYRDGYLCDECLGGEQ